MCEICTAYPNLERGEKLLLIFTRDALCANCGKVIFIKDTRMRLPYMYKDHDRNRNSCYVFALTGQQCWKCRHPLDKFYAQCDEILII